MMELIAAQKANISRLQGHLTRLAEIGIALSSEQSLPILLE